MRSHSTSTTRGGPAQRADPHRGGLRLGVEQAIPLVLQLASAIRTWEKTHGGHLPLVAMTAVFPVTVASARSRAASSGRSARQATRIRETTRRVERLQTTEAKLRQRLYSLETMLHAIRQDIESAQESDMEENEDLEPIAGDDIPSSTPPPKKTSASDDKDVDESEIRAV
mgnify:CR=1 FL=1